MQVASRKTTSMASILKRGTPVLRQHAGLERRRSCQIVQAAYTITELAGGRVYTLDKVGEQRLHAFIYLRMMQDMS